MKFVLCYPGSKQPIGHDWGSRLLTADEVAQRLAENPTLNVGLVPGPVSDCIDVECDSETATKSYDELFAGTRAPGWNAKKGRHHLYKHDPRFANLPAVVKLLGIEFRIGGNGKAIQSICPPSTVDGVTRQWIINAEDCEPPPVPEHVIATLLAAPKAKPSVQHTEIPGAQQAAVRRMLRYCERVGLKVQGTHGEDPTYIDLLNCPYKHLENEKGAPAFVVNADGSVAFHCFHASCADKRLADVEALLGPVRPVIRLGNDLGPAIAQSIHALEDSVFQRGGLLVEVSHEPKPPKLCLTDNGSLQFRPVAQATLRATLSSAAKWQKWQKDEYKACLPTDAVVSAVLNSAQYPGVPVVTGVVSCPVLRADGTIADKAGYDPDTGLYIDTEGDYPALMRPDVAVAMLADLVSDFPFASLAHRSGCFAALITQLARAAFAGSSPFFLFDGNTSRVGKGLLTDLNATIVEGRKAARYSFPENGELRKLITSVALSGAPYILFDNIKGKFGGATIENAMTAGRWSDRILGLNRHVDLPLNLVWLGTSNNATLSKDMIGRTVHVRLESNLERPDLRNDFRRPDLLAYAKEHRRELVVAALSIPVQYIRAGRPDQHLPAWGGFQEWSDLVRGSIVWAGLPDPDTRESLAEQADDETDQLRLLLDGWEQVGEAKVSEAIAKIDAGEAPILQSLLAGLPGERRSALGNLLRQYRRTVLDGQRLDRTDSKVPRWHVIQA